MKLIQKLAVIAWISVAILLCTVKHVHAGDIIVQTQGLLVKLSPADVRYVLSKTTNVTIRQALLLKTQTIRNNDVADAILAIIKLRKL